jgi:hypothetical protein
MARQGFASGKPALRGSFKGPAARPDKQLSSPGRKNGSPQERLARLEGLEGRLRAHLKRSEPMWTGREAVKLLRKHVRPKLNHPVPLALGALPAGASPSFIDEQARRNVRARITRRMSHLNEIRKSITQEMRGPKREALRPRMNHQPVQKQRIRQ